jgi:hypothetical protein
MIEIVVNNYFRRCCIYTTLKKLLINTVFSSSIYDGMFVVNCFWQTIDI